eukprot:gnl/Hemi2/6345_TR2172_c0_g1_i1.p1 gnl/Hemi2/6345_TR2172_c0_g1~~gnl/Hemi2/6345_TR2172_c0_g1_i1.p1  ORF type:complete len:348 (+),score=107.36 gnl/Hemi2/6345_TR2172_c0_g1_i1:49-1092(+)
MNDGSSAFSVSPVAAAVVYLALYFGGPLYMYLLVAPAANNVLRRLIFGLPFLVAYILIPRLVMGMGLAAMTAAGFFSTYQLVKYLEIVFLGGRLQQESVNSVGRVMIWFCSPCEIRFNFTEEEKKSFNGVAEGWRRVRRSVWLLAMEVALCWLVMYARLYEAPLVLQLYVTHVMLGTQMLLAFESIAGWTGILAGNAFVLEDMYKWPFFATTARQFWTLWSIGIGKTYRRLFYDTMGRRKGAALSVPLIFFGNCILHMWFALLTNSGSLVGWTALFVGTFAGVFGQILAETYVPNSRELSNNLAVRFVGWVWHQLTIIPASSLLYYAADTDMRMMAETLLANLGIPY